MKKSRKVLVILIIIVALSIVGCLAYYYMDNNKEEKVKVIKKIPKFGYNLNDNETKLYKDTFDELYKILNKDSIDYEAYGKCISKLFIIDFYTLDNKISKNDIGGTDFIKEDMRDNFVEQSRSTFYKYLEVKSTSRNQKLPEVSKIDDVTIENVAFTYKDKTVDENAYKVSIQWSYKEDLGYENSAKMILVRQDSKLYIVEMN